jgi:hypothetical protein
MRAMCDRRMISGTLACAMVTGLLAGVHAGLVLRATRALAVHAPVAVAASALGAAALFAPQRRKVQRGGPAVQPGPLRRGPDCRGARGRPVKGGHRHGGGHGRLDPRGAHRARTGPRVVVDRRRGPVRYPAAALRARYAATCSRLPQVRLSQ